MNKLSYRICILSMFIAFALVLSYVELLIPFSYGYGIKLGLANIVIISILYVFSFREALIVCVLRILISGLLFGNVISIIFSFSGGLLSLFVMFLFKRFSSVSIVLVSVMGGLFHNAGQLMAAFAITKAFGLVYYLPVLMVGGVVTGIVTGLLADMVIKVLKEIFKNDRIFKR